MKLLNATMTAALVSACLGLGACAQNQANRSPGTAPNPNKAQTAPSPSAVQQQQANPSNENMDANAQRAHTRASGSTPSSTTSRMMSQPAVGEVRDWAAIDKNRDNLIQPEEMEAALKAGKPSSGKQ